MAQPVTIGHRRFTCLSPNLVRMEFSPTGEFEDRPSIVAAAAKRPRSFRKTSKDGAIDILDTGFMTLRTSENDRPMNRLNLEIRWTDPRVLQFWRPGDRDHQNLGGTLRSLDRYGGPAARLDGVHAATMEPPDNTGTNWPAWHQCEVDPVYKELHPDPPAGFGRGSWLRMAAEPSNPGQTMHRTWNWYVEARKFCPGILSRSGYYFLNDSESAVLDDDGFPIEREQAGYQDWYFFAYGSDYRQALADWRLLSGPAPLPPRQSLGIMFSRWPAFTAEEIEELHAGFRDHGYPLATLIMDMEWHKEGWGHWEFNRDLIPDPRQFFKDCHDKGLDVVFNDHPLDVREDDVHFESYVEQAGPDVEIRERDYNDKRLKMAKVDITNKQQATAFVDLCHEPIRKLGLDFWWNDGSRGQMAGTCGQLVANKLFYEEIETRNRRGMLLARYGGLGSHRYGGFFTGDTGSTWEVLRLQCEFNIRAGHIGINYVSHDIGGFMTNGKPELIDPKIYTRWLQFGVFNTVLRFHCAPNAGSRRPWDYDEKVDGACRKWLRIRHSLLPYINTANRHCYETGVPAIRGMFLDDPDNLDADRFDQFCFGEDMVVAPVLGPESKRDIYLPEGLWWPFEGGGLPQVGGVAITREVPLDDVPVYVRAGRVIPRQDPDGEIHAGHTAALRLDVYPGAGGESSLYEDDGETLKYQRRGFCRTRYSVRDDGEVIELSSELAAGKPIGESREIAVTLPLERQPTKVSLDGKCVAKAKIREASPGRWEIDLGRRNADAAWALKVAR